MPIYEYACRDCGVVSEFILLKPDNPPKFSCPECGSRHLEKKISLPGGVASRPSPRPGSTCCGRDERCEAPPCSTSGSCRRD